MRAAISLTILSRDRVFADALEIVLSGEEDLRVSATQALHGEDGAGLSLFGVDVILIDGTMGRDAALAATVTLRERSGNARLLVIGLEREDESILDFVEAGAAGYVLQDASPTALADAIRSLHSGRTLCSPRIAAAALARIKALSQETRLPGASVLEGLTGRELELLSLLAQGLGNKEIGRALRITAQTVKNHVHHILAKLGVHRRRDAVRIAYERGLLRESLDLF
jgi:DNA-binding NarL/FixJ family response regulator